jgi:pimeloyl-ACP methyl ester carboxylesterase
MNTLVVCVHGIGQQLSGEDTMLSDWVPALRDGIRRVDGEPPPPEQIGMAFYGDLFRKKGTKSLKSLNIPPYDENDVTEEWERQILEAWWLAGAHIDRNVPGPGDQTKLRTPRVVQRALNALSHSRFFANIALNAFVADLKQVYAYLHDEVVCREAQRRVQNVITDQTRVVVGHSLGTVVAYEALCAHPEWPVRTFVSLGSPLGISNLIFELLRPAPESGVGVWPKALAHWSNIADEGDIVALVKDLRSRFGDSVQDYLVNNGSHAHDVRPYLTSQETGHAITQGLTG